MKKSHLSYIKYSLHFVRVFIALEVGLQCLHINFFRDIFFEHLGPGFIFNVLWNIGDGLLLLLVLAGFFKYLKKEGSEGMAGYFRWIICSFSLIFFINARLFYFFQEEDPLLLSLAILDFDYGIFLVRFIIVLFAIVFLALLYFDVFSKSLFILELPFLVGLLLWFFLMSVRSFNFLFLFLIMESITLLIVVVVSIYFIFFGAKLLKPIIHFFVFNLIISTFFLLGLGLLFFFIPVSGSENLTYFMVLVNFWVLSLAGFIDPLLLLFMFKFSLACFLLPFLFKITLAPFSFWVVNIYSKLPIIFLFLLMGVYKLVYVLLFLKLFLYIFDIVSALQISFVLSVVWCILPSMFIGCLAYRTADLKTILALTTVSQMGYIIAGLVTHDIMAIKYAIVYLLVYICNIFGIFIIFVKLQKEFFLVSVNQLFLVKYYSKKWFYILFILFGSLAGFPPFAGFFLKYFIFLHIYKSGFFVLAAAGVISGYIMSIIYLQLLMELSMLKGIPWATYQVTLVNSIVSVDSQKYSMSGFRKNGYMWYSKTIFHILTIILISLGFMNLFFIGLLPFFSQYFGFFAFFFIYGLYWNIEFPPVREELLWFVSGFTTIPEAELTKEVTELELFSYWANISLDSLFFKMRDESDQGAPGEAKFMALIQDDLGSKRIIFNKTRESAFPLFSYAMAWVIPSLSIDKYLSAVDLFEAISPIGPDGKPFLSLGDIYKAVLPGVRFVYGPTSAFVENTTSFDEPVVRIGYELITRSAYDIYSPHLFGYGIWDADAVRFLPSPGVNFYTANKYPFWYVGYKDAPVDFSKVFIVTSDNFSDNALYNLMNDILQSNDVEAKTYVEATIKRSKTPDRVKLLGDD